MQRQGQAQYKVKTKGRVEKDGIDHKKSARKLLLYGQAWSTNNLSKLNLKGV